MELHSKKVYMVVIDTFVEFLPHHFFLAMLCIMKKSIKMQSSLLKALKKDLQLAGTRAAASVEVDVLSNECTSPAQFHANYRKVTGFLGVNWASAVSGH